MQAIFKAKEFSSLKLKDREIEWLDPDEAKNAINPITKYLFISHRPSAEIMAEIMDLQTELKGSLEEIFEWT